MEIIEYDPELTKAIETLRAAQLDPSNGLSHELFWLISSLVPIVNVDLLIVNDNGQLLLTWRDDEFYRRCWHIPGGCIRFGETMIQRAHETAKMELGIDVIIDEQPLAIRDAINPPFHDRRYPNERRHNVSILYKCYVPKDFDINNRAMKENDPGYQKWFDRLPEDFVSIQHIYDDILKPWICNSIFEQ